jgi:hypothetical protein
MQRRSRLGKVPHRFVRHGFNLWPAIRGTGVRVTSIAPDWSQLQVRLKLSWRTRNYVGTIFGGSIYGAVDPFLMLMFMHRLGDGYVVWDRAATIRFRRPAKRTLFATFEVPDVLLATIRSEVDAVGELVRSFPVTLADADGVVHAHVDKELYFATREAYAAKLAARSS